MPAPKLSDRATPLLYATARLPCVQVTAPQQARPPYFLSAPCTALLHPWLFEDRIPERLGPRPSTDRTPDTSVQQLSQLIQPPKPTPSFAGFSRLEDLRRSYLVWRTFARMSPTDPLLTTHQPSPLTSAGQHHHAGSFPRHLPAVLRITGSANFDAT